MAYFNIHNVITCPINWSKHGNLEICSVDERLKPRLVEFLWEQCFKQNAIYQKLKLVEEEGMEERYKHYVRHVLRNESSIAVMGEDRQTIVACALLVWMTAEWRSWICLLLNAGNGLFQEIISMDLKMIAKCRETTETDFNSLHMLEYYVTDELQNSEGFLQKFFYAVGEVARHMHMPRVTFMALRLKEQNTVLAHGFNEVARIIYSIHVVNGKRPFDILRTMDEMFAVMFEMPVTPLISYLDFPGFEQYHAKYDKDNKESKRKTW